MIALRKKVKIKCDCGQIVAAGSVYCPHCKAEISRKNAKVIMKDERNYRKNTRNQGRKKK